MCFISVALFHSFESVFGGIPPGEEFGIFGTSLDKIFGEHTENNDQGERVHQGVDNEGNQAAVCDGCQKTAQKPDAKVSDQKGIVQLIRAVAAVHEA